MAGYTLDEVNAFPDAPTAGGSEGYSFDEVNALPDAPDQEEPGLVRSFAKAVVDPLSKIGGSVLKTLLPKSLEGSVGGGQVDSILGGKVDTVGYRDGRELKGAEFAKDLGGTVLEGASYLPMGGVAVQGAKMLGKTLKAGKVAQGTLPKVLGLAMEGGLGGGLVGAGSALQRNEDVGTVLQEGAYGTALGAIGGPVLGHYAPQAIGKVAKAVPQMMTQEGRVARSIANREKEIYDIETGYTKLNQKNAYKEDARNESRKRVAETDVLVDTVDTDGKIQTKIKGGAVDQYKSLKIDGKEGIVKDLLKAEGKLINIKDVEKYLEKTILEDEKLAGGSLESAYSRIASTIKGLSRKADANGNIPLDLVHNAKISETSNINYSIPSSKAEAKAVARGLKELIERESGQNIKEINDELAKYYSDLEMIAELDGKRVKGGRLGKYFATGSGNIIGGLTGNAVGGPIGGAIGAALGGEVSGRIMGSQMARTFGRATGKTVEKSKILQKAEDDIAKLPLTLPAPKFGRDYIPTQENNLGIPKTQYNNAQSTSKTSIPKSIAPKAELQGVDKEAFESMNYYFDNTDGPQMVRYQDKNGDYQTYRTSTSMADFPDNLKSRALFNRVKPYWDRQEVPKSPLMKELYDELTKRMGQMKTKLERAKNTETSSKIPDGAAFAGAPVGIGQDEEGNTTFDPKMMALGMIGGHIAGKSNILAKAKGSKLEEFIVKARKETGKTDEALTNIWKNANKSTLANVTKHDKDVVKALADAKGMSAEDIMSKYPDIQLKRDVVATDLDGKKITIPEGEALTPYEMKGGKVVLQDGETYVVSKNQYQNIKGNAVSTEAKPFAPELSGTEETTNGWREGNKPTRYSQYVLPDGKDYREILIKAPVKKSEASWTKTGDSSWKAEIDGRTFGIKDEGTGGFYVYEKDGILGKTVKNYTQAVEAVEEKIKDTGKFQSSHWSGEPNVVSHLRMNDRTYNGKKVAFMEELQSDWAREERAGKTNVTSPLLKNWQEMTIKRALKDAVDNDAEYFAWINGEQTSARYNLATQVDNVDWEIDPSSAKRQAEGYKNVIINPKGGKSQFNILIDKNGKITSSIHKDWIGKNIDEALGKGLADKIMADETGKLSGDGLKFGGEWANALYDRQVPNIVKDLTGAKAEIMDMGLPSSPKRDVFQVGDSSKDLTTEHLKKGLEISKGSYGKDKYVVTDILGDGKFKAVTKEELYPESQVGTVLQADGTYLNIGDKWFRTGMDKTFDISTPKSAGQMGIKLTPEIKAMIRGEAAPIKPTSGKSPFGKASVKKDDKYIRDTVGKFAEEEAIVPLKKIMKEPFTNEVNDEIVTHAGMLKDKTASVIDKEYAREKLAQILNDHNLFSYEGNLTAKDDIKLLKLAEDAGAYSDDLASQAIAKSEDTVTQDIMRERMGVLPKAKK